MRSMSPVNNMIDIIAAHQSQPTAALDNSSERCDSLLLGRVFDDDSCLIPHQTDGQLGVNCWKVENEGRIFFLLFLCKLSIYTSVLIANSRLIFLQALPENSVTLLPPLSLAVFYQKSTFFYVICKS